MKASSIIEVLSAAHLSVFVDRNVFEQRGGIFLVAPPGNLKSTFIANSIRCYPDALRLADLNVQTLGYIKKSFVDGKYSSLAFGEYEKLYQRNPATAANIEGHLKAMVEEGMNRQSWEDPHAACFEARVLVLAGVTPSCHQRLVTRWIENGFSRRFLWMSYQLADRNIIIDAIDRWKPLNFGKSIKEVPNNNSIPYNVTKDESKKIRNLISGQVGMETPYVLSKKIFSVLKWRHNAKKAAAIFEDFAEGLGERPAKVTV